MNGGDDWFVRDIAHHVDLAGPGVYAWRIDGVVVYVGKASRLRSRLRSIGTTSARSAMDGRTGAASRAASGGFTALSPRRAQRGARWSSR